MVTAKAKIDVFVQNARILYFWAVIWWKEVLKIIPWSKVETDSSVVSIRYRCLLKHCLPYIETRKDIRRMKADDGRTLAFISGWRICSNWCPGVKMLHRTTTSALARQAYFIQSDPEATRMAQIEPLAGFDMIRVWSEYRIKAASLIMETRSKPFKEMIEPRICRMK